MSLKSANGDMVQCGILCYPSHPMNPATELKALIKKVQSTPSLRRRMPRQAAKLAWHLDLSLVSAPEMKKLNLRYRNKNQPTDVLSFPAVALFREQGILGSLAICTPVLKAQAREAGHSQQAELRVLLVHGILHLLGMDHEGSGLKAKRAASEMKRWEKKLLGSAGASARSTSVASPKSLIARTLSDSR